MQINNIQGLNAYTAVQPRQENTQETAPVQPAETEQTSLNQEAAVVEISTEASAQLAAEEETAVQPPAQTTETSQPPGQTEQTAPVIDIVA
ncbi:MAG: hypothetical protein HUN04_23230 [Desulfobacter sp.]|nr:MAG: hypothetical protein HUN04_23230 [Desulfobacter sp.]